MYLPKELIRFPAHSSLCLRIDVFTVRIYRNTLIFVSTCMILVSAILNKLNRIITYIFGPKIQIHKYNFSVLMTDVLTSPDVTIACDVLCFNTLRPRQNGRHLADDIFKCIFLNENVWIPIKISLKFVRKGPINTIPSLFQIMVWRRPGAKPLS